jgi:hypothetical protein
MGNNQPDGITLNGWLVKVTPVQGGGEPLERRFVAGFATAREAELEVRDLPGGRGNHVVVERQLLWRK